MHHRSRRSQTAINMSGLGIYDGFNSSDVPWGHGQVLVCGWVPVVARGQRFRGICYKTFYRYIESGFAFSMKPVVKM